MISISELSVGEVLSSWLAWSNPCLTWNVQLLACVIKPLSHVEYSALGLRDQTPVSHGMFSSWVVRSNGWNPCLTWNIQLLACVIKTLCRMECSALGLWDQTVETPVSRGMFSSWLAGSKPCVANWFQRLGKSCLPVVIWLKDCFKKNNVNSQNKQPTNPANISVMASRFQRVFQINAL